MLSQASKVTGLGLGALLCGVVIVGACGSGGDDNSQSTAGGGGGGTTNAGSGGTGGSNAGATTAGTAGSTTAGTGGNTAQVPTTCAGVVPASATIADFNTPPGVSGKYEWGSADQGTMDFWGGTFNYPDALMLAFADGAMTATGHITEYAGFGLYVQNCANASSFEGVRFKIKGNPPLGKMSFAVQMNKNEWATGIKGSCLAPDAQKFINCVHPGVPITVTDTLTAIEVKWADLKAGKPATAATTDGSDMIGLQFILPWVDKMAPYDATITIDDVEFIGVGTGAGGAGSGTAGAGGAP